jgi:predicted site-specific integrase-resolvase
VEVEMDDGLVTIERVARRLGVKPSTVRAGVKRGLIPAVVLWRGKRRSLVRFRVEDIERLIRERSVGVTSE